MVPSKRILLPTLGVVPEGTDRASPSWITPSGTQAGTEVVQSFCRDLRWFVELLSPYVLGDRMHEFGDANVDVVARAASVQAARNTPNQRYQTVLAFKGQIRRWPSDSQELQHALPSDAFHLKLGKQTPRLRRRFERIQVPLLSHTTFPLKSRPALQQLA
ncbi:hypothetical protein AAF712_002904 [Marasmius tenuissimus]|uniref:Uncharacterized protein n=1 Tax=Marasmius tenuissimus TaxID=585030 RepID=A0ABR3A7Q3_9AGAR